MGRSKNWLKVLDRPVGTSIQTPSPPSVTSQQKQEPSGPGPDIERGGSVAFDGWLAG